MIRHVRLELARCHDFPDGSPDRGYDLTLPLTEDGHLDSEDWLNNRQRTRFHRFWNGNEDSGAIKHDRHGWRLIFENQSEGDEVLFKGDRHRFVKGEYISVAEPDGMMRTFRVAEVK